MISSISNSAINSIQNALSQAYTSASNISSSFTGDYSNYTDDAFVNDIVSLKLSNVQLEASVKILKESFEMQECLLDIIA